MRVCVLFVAFMAIYAIANAQQDPQFSQNMFNHVTVNPAFAGIQNRWVISGIYRNQWQAMDGAPETYAFNVDGPLRIKRMDGGIGLNMMSDKLGMQTNLHLMLDYAYKRKLRLGVLSVGIKVGVVNAKIEGEYYIPDDDNHTQPGDDEALNGSDVNVSKIMFDMGIGAFFTGEKLYAGMAISHLTKPEMTIGLKGRFFFTPHMYFTGGYTLPLSWRWDLQPSVFVSTDFASTQYNVNANVVFDKLYWGGISYRYEEAVIFMGGLELKNGIMVGYSYDWNVSDTGKYTGGSHEVTLSYSFGLKLGKRQKIYKSVRFL